MFVVLVISKGSANETEFTGSAGARLCMMNSYSGYSSTVPCKLLSGLGMGTHDSNREVFE